MKLVDFYAAKYAAQGLVDARRVGKRWDTSSMRREVPQRANALDKVDGDAMGKMVQHWRECGFL